MGHTAIWTHETVLAAEAVSAAKARAFVREHLLAHGLPDLVEDIRLVVSELATNAMVHAQTAFAVILERVDDSVILTVRDRSPSVPVPIAANVLATSGRGLSIVQLVSRDWGVTVAESGAKCVWASFGARTREPVLR